jgi:hypothetical protein
MFAPHRLALLHRWVLAWFMLSLGVAVAAPVAQPQSMELVCSGTGSIRVVVHTDDGVHEEGRLTMDCALCAPSGAPPAWPAMRLPSPPPPAYAVRPIPMARLAAATRSPLPARGPPPLF